MATGLVPALTVWDARPDLPGRAGWRRFNRASIGGPRYPPASPHRQTTTRQSRNIDLVSIDYAFRPRLRYRLTLSGLTFLRKP